MSFIPLKKNNPCPICDRDDGRCREVDELILCMTVAERAEIPGWRFLGQSKDKLWGKWAPDNRRDWTEQQRQQWRQEQSELKRQRLEAEAKRHAEAMPASERDPHYRLLLSQLGLTASDRREIETRFEKAGIPSQEWNQLIQHWGVRSIAPWQRLTTELPHTLPGVDVSGRSLFTKWSGYLCPVRDVDGAIVAFQIRTQDKETRYPWLSQSATEKRPNPPVLQVEGENPLSVFRPLRQGDDRAIALTEGTGAKPFIACYKLGVPTVGAAGGLFASSPNTLKATLEQLATEQNSRTVWFCPDGGAIANNNVLRQYRTTFKLLQSWGFEVQILWWGQATKQNLDIDELSNLEGVEKLTVAQFEDLTAPHGFSPKAASIRDRYVQKRIMRFLGYWGELLKDFNLTDADIIFEGYAPKFELLAGSIMLRGWLGAGKTEATLRSLLPYRNKVIPWITNRNGLLYQTAERARRLGFDVYHYQDDPALYREMMRVGQPGIYTLCPDSLKDYAVSQVRWSDVIVVIDEFSGVRREVLKKSAIMPEFERLLSECETVIAVDAFLSDVDRRVIEKYRPGSIQVIDQQFEQSPKRVTWLETRNQAGDISFSHDGIAYPLLKKWVSEGKRFAIATDTKLQAKALHQHLQKLGYNGVLCSSETIENNQVLLPNPDPILATAHYFIYTPTAQSGLDCQVSFDCGLALYNGVISPIDFLQMIGRCRQCKQWFVSSPRRSLDPSCPVPSLESSRVKGWGVKLAATFADLGATTGPRSLGWGLWQSLTGDVERAFHSEYLKSLLQQFFASVEVAEVECDRPQWIEDVKRIKDQELRLMLGADLENGQRLLRQQKAPSKDTEVWDIALADQFEKYPQVWRELRQQFLSGVDVDEAIALAKLFTSKRLDRLKYWVQATGDHAAADLADLRESIKTKFTSYSSPRWKALQNLSLFQHLNLDQLATATGKATAHTTHYRIDSPIITELWAEFERSPNLHRLFPTVETIADFWAIIRRCMAFFGYESAGQTIRVDTPGQQHPNGKDRKGRQRFSESASRFFCGWVPMAASGSAFFQQNFDLIIESIRDRLDWERRHRQTERERSLAPPLAA